MSDTNDPYRSVLWTSPSVAMCPGDGHHNFEHGSDTCECGALKVETGIYGEPVYKAPSNSKGD